MENTKFKTMIDISTNSTPDFQEYCAINVSDSGNITMDTWYNLCSQYANNEVVALDPQWDFTAKFEKGDAVGAFIVDKKYKVGLERTAKVKLINLEEGKEITFTAVFDDITKTYETETVTEVAFAIKVHRGNGFEIKDYVAPSA